MLWRSRADGSERLQLSYPPMRAFPPRWSPDSRRIASMAQLPSKPWKVFVVSAEGGAPQQLIPGEEGNEADPCWSPDGNSLTFDTLERSGIHILDLRTHQLSTLRGSDTFWNPLWSPDGLYMAATTQDSQRFPSLAASRPARFGSSSTVRPEGTRLRPLTARCCVRWMFRGVPRPRLGVVI